MTATMSLQQRKGLPPCSKNGWVHFTGTCQDEKFDWKQWFDENDLIRYVCAGFETAPTTGKKHWQWYAMQTKPRKNIKLYQKYPNLHAEACWDYKKSWGYAKKGKEWVEYGKPKGRGQGKRNDIVAVKDRIRDEGMTELEIWEENPHLAAQYGRRLEHYRSLLQERRTWKTAVRIWWGPAGTGKTTKAREWLGDSYDMVSMHNGFVIGYTNNPNVLIDELDHDSIKRSTFLQMGDEHPCRVNVKNMKHGMVWNARKLAITSNYDPKLWFADDGVAAMRRAEHIELCTEVVCPRALALLEKKPKKVIPKRYP